MLRLGAAVVLLVGLVCCSASPPTADPDHVAEIEEWRSERLSRLTSDSGWLTLAGLHWLQPGENSFGGSEMSQICLTGDRVPSRAGTLELSDDGLVTLQPEPGAGIAIDGTEVVTERTLASDADGTPDVLELGSLRLYLIERGGRVALRVKDPNSEARRRFSGIDHFPVASRFKVEGRFEPLAEPRPITIASVVGTAEEMIVPGIVVFELDGKELKLLPIASSLAEEELFFVFRDATSGHETYGAGRFLVADAPVDGHVTLDFNRAYNPPCAFTPYATCPLPPKENVLDVAITAGEKATAGH